MTHVYELTRLHIAGPIKPDTPTCVIIEIARGLRIVLDTKELSDVSYIERVVKSISDYKLPIPVVKGDPTGFKEKDLSTLVTFVNTNTDFTWKAKPLLQAFHHLCLFYKVVTPPLPDGDFTVGQKTMSVPLAYNACMLYRLCTYYGIRTTRSTSIEQMAQATRELNQDPDVLRNRLMVTIQSLSKVSLINLLASPELLVAPSPRLLPLPHEDPSPSSLPIGKATLPSINPETLTSKALSAAYRQLNDPESTLPRIRPTSQEESIILAAIIYAVNLTECSNPYEEFMAMKTPSSRYVPTFDIKFQQRYLRNPSWFDVRRTWCSRLPDIYKSDHVREFALAEGYPTTEFNTYSPSALMAMSRITPTFHLGRHPDCSDTHTCIIMQNATTVNPQLLITYGISDGGPYALYTIAELADCFMSFRSYINPMKADDRIPTAAISKLRNIAKENTRLRGEGKTTEVEVTYARLLTVMDEVDLYSKATSDMAKRLAVYYKDGDEKTRSNILNMLTCLLHMAYYMRGWKATDEHKEIPIARNRTTFPSDAQGQVFLNTSMAIRDFEISVDQLQPLIRSFVRTLPLMHIVLSQDEVSFQASTSREQGYTIFERIGIVKAGTSDYSCIRMSSNRFAASACFYMIACSQATPFNPRLLTEIS